MKKIILVATLLLAPILVWAETTPPAGAIDSRVRVIDYDPLEVVRLATFYGVSTHVQFGDGETISDVAVGDTTAWQVIPRGRHLFFKPKTENADTNVTVITNKRTYQFALVVEARKVQDKTAWRDPKLIYSLSFRYPEEEAAKFAAAAKVKEAQAAAAELKSKLADAKKDAVGQNLDYWAAGSEEIRPTAARDDGRFIYLTFSNNRDMPAVYAVDEEGNESLINTNVDGNTIAVQRLVRKLVLRKGSYAVCIVNKAFNLNAGSDNTTGTIAPAVQRVIKGEK
jgi:type IV secretion system protein VirB9